MNCFPSIREAKDFIVSRIVEEAQREAAPLSELERKMLYFSEPEMSQTEADLCAEFDRNFDQDCYERKIAGLIKKTDRRYRTEDHQEYGRWRSATQMLLQEDHYLGVMIAQAKLRPPWDFLKLALTAFLIFGVLMAGILLLAKWDVEMSRETIGFWVWVTMVGLAVPYLLVRLLVGKDRFDGAWEALSNRIFRPRRTVR